MDVAFLPLSIKTASNVVTSLIKRNTTVSIKKSEIYTANTDKQPGVQIQLTKNERARAKDNKILEKFESTGIPPAPCGVPQVESLSMLMLTVS